MFCEGRQDVCQEFVCTFAGHRHVFEPKVEERVKETLYAYANSNMMNGITSDMDYIEIVPWWKTTMICIDVALGVLMLGAIACFVLWGYVFKKKEGYGNEAA